MPSEAFGWSTRIKAVEREYTTVRTMLTLSAITETR